MEISYLSNFIVFFRHSRFKRNIKIIIENYLPMDMNKKNKLPKLLICLLCFSVPFFGQMGRVGINTASPRATLDITAKTTDGSQAEGLLIPRLSGDQIKAAEASYGTEQDGALIYATSGISSSSSNTLNITSSGYYYYDASNSVWQSLAIGTAQAVVSDCNSNGLEGTYINGVAMTSSNKFSVTLTNKLFSDATIDLQPSDLVLSGISGIIVSSVSPTSVTLAPGQSQLVEYALSGTPVTSGTLVGAWTKISLNCLKTVDVTSPTITSLDCGVAIHSGTLTGNISANGVSSTISYTGGNGSGYIGQTVPSTGVTGLTATLSSGTLANGSGSLLFTITGTPSGAGTASFAISIGGQSCTLTRTVAAPVVIPSNITLAQNSSYMMVSVYDEDYLPYTVPGGLATTNIQAADGVDESTPIMVYGIINTIGLTLALPVTASGSGTLPAFNQTITIPSSLTMDGISRNLIFSWPAQAYTSSTKSITATLKAVGGTLYAKRLDINAGIGSDALGILLGQFIYPYNNAGNTTTYNVRIIAVVPDKMFGIADNAGLTTHKMVYVPVVAEDGKIWLNNNLGANYANIGKPAFNPAQQASSSTDYNAYGSLFQWGRKPDGHELITWSNSTAGTGVYGTTSTVSNMPTDALFIVGSSNWRIIQDDTLWIMEASANNPCPAGFRIPTITELSTLFTAGNITNSSTAAVSTLKLTTSGYRNYGSGSLQNTGVFGNYWSSSVSGTTANTRGFDISTFVSNYNRAFGFSIRCVKN